jgi:hypothetical protein
MNRERCFIQIAFEFKSGLANEAFILRVVAYGRQFLASIRFPDPPQVYVKKCVSAGQQAGYLRRSLLSQLHGNRHGCDD